MPQTHIRTLLAADKKSSIGFDFLQEPMEKFCRTETNFKFHNFDHCLKPSFTQTTDTHLLHSGDTEDGASGLVQQFTSILDVHTTFTFLTNEGLSALAAIHAAERAAIQRYREAIARPIPLADDRLRLGTIASKMACRMLVSYDAFALPGYRSFICHDSAEWAAEVTEKGWNPQLMLTSDVGPRNKTFTSKSGTRSYINVLFDCFAQSVKFFTEPVTFFAALAYLDRLHANYYATLITGLQRPDAPSPLRIYEHHIMRLMTCLMIIACKMHADLKSTISYYLRNVPGLGSCGLTIKELVALEIEVLEVLEFNATVDKTHIRSLLASFASPQEEEIVSKQLFY